MKTCVALAGLVLLCIAAPLNAGAISGEYVEARTCDVWTGACFANAEMNLTGKHAVLAWKIDKGTSSGVALDGLSVLAVVEATDTLGLEQRGAAKSVIIVDEKASPSQRDALVALAKKLGGALTKNVLSVEAAPIQVSVNRCKEGGCALVETRAARIETRCIHEGEDSVCGHEDNFYPPLTRGVKAKSAMVLEHRYSGKAFNKTWNDASRRGAYIGTFNLSQ